MWHLSSCVCGAEARQGETLADCPRGLLGTSLSRILLLDIERREWFVLGLGSCGPGLPNQCTGKFDHLCLMSGHVCRLDGAVRVRSRPGHVKGNPKAWRVLTLSVSCWLGLRWSIRSVMTWCMLTLMLLKASRSCSPSSVSSLSRLSCC